MGKKRLLCKSKDRNSDPQNLSKIQASMKNICNPSTREGETGYPQGKLDSYTSQNQRDLGSSYSSKHDSRTFHLLVG